MNTLPEDAEFTTYLRRRVAASDAFVDGDVQPLLAVSSHVDPVSIFPPSGTVVVGAEAVDAANVAGAASLEPGSKNVFDEAHSGVGGDLAYWTGVQRSTVRFAGKAEPVSMELRLTEIYRRENGEWKLIHRHADTLAA